MKDESEEARLMGDKTTSNSMAYTDGPKIPFAAAEGGIIPTSPPAYEKTVKGAGVNCHGDEKWRKGSGSDQSQDSELLNEFMNYNGETLMTQFHADALKQVGFGKYQHLVILMSGFAMGAQGLHLYSLFYVLSSMELEFCMWPGQKDYIAILNVITTAGGTLFGSGLAEVNGRKRTLLTCMMCMTLFTLISAFMPTLGTYTMAKLLSSFSAGGIFPIAATLIGEVTSGKLRGPSIVAAAAFGFGGAMFAGSGALLMLPLTGEDLVLEQREHFSSWHRYMLAMSFLMFLPILGLLSMSESPRWLLEVGREVEALSVYQRMFSINRKNGKCTLTELELPGMRSERHGTPKSVLRVMANNVYKFIDSFRSTLRQSYMKTTFLLEIIWFVTLFISYGLTVCTVKMGRSEQVDQFHRSTVVTFNNTLENINLTLNIVNQNFENCHFYNVTFDQIFLSYVQFNNCTFLDTDFHGVKTGNTTFVNTFFNNVKFIDTNVADQNFINCVKTNTEVDRMIGGCNEQYEYNIYDKVFYYVNMGWVMPLGAIFLWTALVINQFGRIRVSTFCIFMAGMMCCIVGFVCINDVVYWIVGIIQSFLFAALIALTVYITEYYCSYTRCSALGLFTFYGHMGGLTGAFIFLQLQIDDIYMPAIMAIAGLSLPCLLTTLLKETSQLL